MDPHEDLLWKETFFKDNFSVDQCLSQYTIKSDLETLRSELKNYGVHLQQQMSEILKLETEAIVNLAEFLTNLSTKIEDLSLPICQLREEIRNLFDLIKAAEESYRTSLENLKSNNTKQHHIVLTLGIISSAFYIENMLNSSQKDSFEDLILLERIVNKYSFQRNYIDEIEIIVPDTESILKKVEAQLVNMINKKFLASVKQNDVDTITKCLRMYDNLGKQVDAQKAFQNNIVKPALQPLFTEHHLEQYNHDINKIYEEVLFFMDNTMGTLLDILARNPELESYNFALNSFWAEFDRQSREGLPYITAPGNPELFQKRFMSTWRLLLNIARKCGDVNLVKENETFQDYINGFNLPVYFEIRFQQIAGKFENDILMNLNEDIYCAKNERQITLKLTECFLRAVERCFSPDVFIEHLCDRFIKLSMLLLSRYLTWFNTRIKDGLFDGRDKLEDFLIKSLVDLKIVGGLIGTERNVDETVYRIVPDDVKPIIVKLFGSNKVFIDKSVQNLGSYLVKMKLDACLTQLQSVGAIPRLYRRTNRCAPTSPSTYMVDAVKPVLQLRNKFEVLIQSELEHLMDEIILNITNQYMSLVQEVLMSVCKTEESLRRLKSRNINANEDNVAQSDTTSDEMKIRQQIRLDVSYFHENLYNLSGIRAKQAMDNLKEQTSK